jgi:Matrixin
MYKEINRKLITICGGRLSRLIWLVALLNILSFPAEAAHTDESLPDEQVGMSTEGSSLSDNLPLLNSVSPNFLRMEAQGAPGDRRADYYLQVLQASQDKVFRFKSLPIPVFINSFPDAHFIACVMRSFDSWERRSEGTVRFQQVDDATKARIQVVWKHLGCDQDATGCALGAHTITRYSEPGKGAVPVFNIGGVPVPVLLSKTGSHYAVPPQVVEVNLDLIINKPPNIRYRLLQNVVTHELGHTLGLLGHSPDSHDMMFATTDEHSRLSQCDINTLIKLYQQKTDIPL